MIADATPQECLDTFHRELFSLAQHCGLYPGGDRKNYHILTLIEAIRLEFDKKEVERDHLRDTAKEMFNKFSIAEQDRLELRTKAAQLKAANNHIQQELAVRPER